MTDRAEPALPASPLERDLLLSAALAQIKRMQDFMCSRGYFSKYLDWLEAKSLEGTAKRTPDAARPSEDEKRRYFTRADLAFEATPYGGRSPALYRLLLAEAAFMEGRASERAALLAKLREPEMIKRVNERFFGGKNHVLIAAVMEAYERELAEGGGK